MEGWINLHRQLINSAVFKNEKLLKIWIWCLLKANHSCNEVIIGNQFVKLEEGQFIFGRKKAAEELKMNESTLYRNLKVLEKAQMCNIKSNNKFSVITIEKWEFFQKDDENNNNKMNNKRTTSEQQEGENFYDDYTG